MTDPTEHQALPKPSESAAASPSSEDGESAAVELDHRRTRDRELADSEVLAESRRHTRRAFLGFGMSAVAGHGLYRYIENSPAIEWQPGPLRAAFEFNAELAKKTFREFPLAPTYPVSRAGNLRVNGVFGLKKMLAKESWRLQLVGSRLDPSHPRYVNDVTAWEYGYTQGHDNENQGHDTKVDPKVQSAMKMAPEPMLEKAIEDENRTGRKPRGLEESGESRSTLRPNTPGLLLTMDDIKCFPRTELVTQFKCIEGWSQIVHWAGVRMSDFLAMYPPARIQGREPRFAYMETPDGDYYTGYNLSDLRHPQTLLVTEMMGAPLTQFHGAPLRLYMPIKYGIKQIKRIGLIAFTDERPDDYWTRLGYDWDQGL